MPVAKIHEESGEGAKFSSEQTEKYQINDLSGNLGFSFSFCFFLCIFVFNHWGL